MSTYKYHFSIDLPPIEADTYDEAIKKAIASLTDMSMCSRGAQFLRNTRPTYRGCSYSRSYLEDPDVQS